MVRPTIDLVMPPTVPVNVGLAKGALRSSASCCAEETGLLASLVLFTLVRPTIDLVMPPTVPVNVGLARGALRSNEPCAVPSTPSMADCTNCVVAIWPVLVPEEAVGARGTPVNVGLARGALSESALVIVEA